MTGDSVLAIVVGGPPDESAVAQLAALREHLAVVAIELILCGGPAATPFDSPEGWRVVRIAPDGRRPLVPECWGAGLRAARAPLVAFFSGDTLPTGSWWPRLGGLFTDSQVAAAAGGIVLHPETPSDGAVYFCRYSAFLPDENRQGTDPTLLPGEATVYRRAALLADPRLHQDGEGFWEVVHHQRLRENGWRLRWLDEPLALFVGNPGFVAFVQQRFAHARRFGAERVASGASRVGLLARAAFVPGVMLFRVFHRVAGSPWGRQSLPRALPRLAVYFTAWAAGEAVGAWRGFRD